MRPAFLIPAQTLLSEINKLIVLENRKKSAENAKKDTIKTLVIARNAFIDAEKKYQLLYTAKQMHDLMSILTIIEVKTPEFLDAITAAQSAIAHYAQGVTDKNTPALEQIVQAHLFKKSPETALSPDIASDTESDTESELNEKILSLYQDTQLFGAQLMTLKAKQELLEDWWRSFFKTLGSCDQEKQAELHKTLKAISKNLIKSLHDIQARNNLPLDDLGMIGFYKKTISGPSTLHNAFEEGVSRTDKMLQTLYLQTGYIDEVGSPTDIATSPTDSTKSFSSYYSSSFFSSTASRESSMRSSNDSLSDNDETDEPARKCARR